MTDNIRYSDYLNFLNSHYIILNRIIDIISILSTDKVINMT